MFSPSHPNSKFKAEELFERVTVTRIDDYILWIEDAETDIGFCAVPCVLDIEHDFVLPHSIALYDKEKNMFLTEKTRLACGRLYHEYPNSGNFEPIRGVKCKHIERYLEKECGAWCPTITERNLETFSQDLVV